MIKKFLAVISLINLVSGYSSASDKPQIGPSGNPLPRFVSLRADKAYLRTGPGRQYPIDWVYKRQGLPLEVIDEHGPWRKVRDHEGVTGWMLVSLLSPRRMALIKGKERNLYHESDLKAPVALIVEPGVTARILKCQAIWCRLNVDGTKAWIERRHLWGVYRSEEID